MKAQEFLKKFSTKKDALTAIGQCLLFCDPMFKEELLSIGEEIENYQDKDLAAQVLDFLNEQYGTQFRNNENIKAIIRQIPKVSFDQFASVIMHKKETWSTDPKMNEYLRPATLFGSKNKFQRYSEDAMHYWIKKQKLGGIK